MTRISSREPGQFLRPNGPRRSAKAATGLMAGLIAVPLAALATTGGLSPVAAAAGPELVVNGGFENALTGWSAGRQSFWSGTVSPSTA